jgi:hypothetical protein
LSGQEIERGTLKRVDLDNHQVVVTIGGTDRTFILTDETRVLGVTGRDLAERLKDFTPGSPVMVKPVVRDGKEVLEGIKLGGPRELSSRVLTDTSSLIPLTELGEHDYLGRAGGLYAEGQNERPAEHEKAGLELASRVRPLNERGEPDDDGRIVLLSVGMSNTSQLSEGLSTALESAEGINPTFQFVNGAQGGMVASVIQNTENERGQRYWSVVDDRLRQAGLSREQVQAVWIKQADAGPGTGFPEYAQTLQAELGRIVRLIHERFPHCRLAYLSSRTYGGFATTSLNPEPYAYESGFSVKWLIEAQIQGDPELNYDPEKGPVKAPWLSWGPYLWANGSTPRADGFFYEKNDFAADGTHHQRAGQNKCGRLMLEFFKSDSTTKGWFGE